MTKSLGPSKTMSTPTPLGLEESSTYKVHHSSSKRCSPCNSMVKSAKHYAFIHPHNSYCMLNSDNSTNHEDIWPTRSGFCRIFCIG